MWMLVPLGNPGGEYAGTRHNLGRLMLQRWMAAHVPVPSVVRKLPSGTVYRLGDSFLALVPATFMNLSGVACAEALRADYDPARMLVLLDDKDLPLGLGRLRVSGGDGGHNGMASVIEALGRPDIARLRLGIGPFRRPLADFVLGPWTDGEWARLDALDTPFARFMERLAASSDLGALQGQVNGAGFWEMPVDPGNVLDPPNDF